CLRPAAGRSRASADALEVRGLDGRRRMSLLEETVAWFSDPAQWSGASGIDWRLTQHIGYTDLAQAARARVAVPQGLFLGLIVRLRNLAVISTGALRARPTLGLLTLLALQLGIGLSAPIIALAVLCVPPLLAGICSGMEAVHPATVDAARAQGMTET